MTIIDITSKGEQKQVGRDDQGLQRRRCNWNVVWETRRGEDEAGGVGKSPRATDSRTGR